MHTSFRNDAKTLKIQYLFGAAPRSRVEKINGSAHVFFTEQQKTSYSKNDEMDVHNSCKPTYVHFISVMLAYARRSKEGDARKVEELLQRMEEIYREGNKEMKPNYQVRVQIDMDSDVTC